MLTVTFVRLRPIHWNISAVFKALYQLISYIIHLLNWPRLRLLFIINLDVIIALQTVKQI